MVKNVVFLILLFFITLHYIIMFKQAFGFQI